MKKTFTKILMLVAAFYLPSTINTVKAQSFVEEFDTVANIIGVTWSTLNNSNPAGTEVWGQGNPAVFHAYSGADSTSFINVNYTSTTGGAGVISNWLISPNVSMKNGDMIYFYSRIPTVGTGTEYPDDLQLRVNLTSSQYPGITATDTGDYSMLLVDINPSLITGVYPQVWTLYSATLSGISGAITGSFAFRYWVSSGAGPTGVNSNFIGVDSVAFVSQPTGIAVPAGKIAANIFPNPTHDYLKVVFGKQLSGNTSLKVFDNLGQVVYSNIINANATKEVIDVRNFAAGTYIVKMVNDKETLTTKFAVE